MAKIVCDSLDRSVLLDAQIAIQRVGPKLKAYCIETHTYVQFPRDLRKIGATFWADVIKMSNGGQIFYRAYRNSIRRSKDGEVIA
jgi:hypothetical protein